jgi:phage baseplate assembly protein V
MSAFLETLNQIADLRRRLANAKLRAYSPPSVGEQVVVISPNGDLTTGVAIPAIFQSAHAAPAADENTHILQFADGTLLKYDTAAHELTANVAGQAAVETIGDLTATIGGSLTATVAGNATLQAPAVAVTAATITLNGAVVINGPLTQGMGGAGGAATMQGPVNVTGDVTGGGVSLAQHTHGGVSRGNGSTNPPS